METDRRFEEMLRPLKPIPLVGIGEPKGSNDYMEVPFDDEQILRQHNIAHVTPPAYIPSLPFLTTMEPTTTLLMGEESEVTSDSNLVCDMPATTPLPPTNVREEDSDINSPLGEYVVDFLMENVDVADLPRHLVKQLFSHLLKNSSLTKGMSDEPLGDDSKSISYDVTFLNPLFDFNDDFTLCNDNPLFNEEFEDISSLDPHELTPVIDESTLLVTLPLRCTDILGDAIVDIDLLLGEHLDTLSTRDREIKFNPIRDIEELELILCVICHATTPLLPINVREEDFDINSPLGEYVVDFLMENVDVADLPRHLVKQLFSHLLKNSSLTKGMSDEPLGDDSKPRSYDVTFSNPLFDFNDDSTLCYDNPLFMWEFEDISSLDLPKLTLVIDESTFLVTLPSP
ncbi:hypothetical protein Tco_0820224 [Tanacetum coccineum]|uniref:NAC domain-containing protein n=1 Tax=Tanacetum coccineum TaxID=301880 RepID=A0ABQ5A8V3_9ASTR